MAKYKINPIDIALYFRWADFRYSDKNTVFNQIWLNRETMIAYAYRKDKLYLKKKIDDVLYSLDETDYENEYEDIKYMLQGIGIEYMAEEIRDEYSAAESFFKLTKLQLTFTTDTPVVRRKLRKLLMNLGYKRRSPQLVDRMKKSCFALGISTFVRGGIKCDIGKVDIDEWISFRLKNSDTQNAK